MEESAKAYIMECAGTFALCFISAGAIITNAIARNVIADKLVFLDDDTRWRGPHCLQRLSDLLDRHDFVAGRFQLKHGVWSSYYSSEFSGTNFAIRRDFL